jgi:hypothetical protein
MTTDPDVTEPLTQEEYVAALLSTVEEEDSDGVDA